MNYLIYKKYFFNIYRNYNHKLVIIYQLNRKYFLICKNYKIIYVIK